MSQYILFSILHNLYWIKKWNELSFWQIHADSQPSLHHNWRNQLLFWAPWTPQLIPSFRFFINTIFTNPNGLYIQFFDDWSLLLTPVIVFLFSLILCNNIGCYSYDLLWYCHVLLLYSLCLLLFLRTQSILGSFLIHFTYHLLRTGYIIYKGKPRWFFISAANPNHTKTIIDKKNEDCNTIMESDSGISEQIFKTREA